MSSQDIARTFQLPPHGCVKSTLDTVVTPIDAILGYTEHLHIENHRP